MSAEQLIPFEGNLTDPVYHVVILHPKLRQRYDDMYLVDAALALERFGHKVTIFTSHFDEETVLDAVHPIKGRLNVKYCGWWIPNSICGAFRTTLVRFRAAWFAWKLIFVPPIPKPKVVILDTDTIALFILSWFSRYKTIYIHHFPQIYYSDLFHCSMQVTPDLLTAKTIGYADEIIVQTSCLREIFRKSFPKIARNAHVLHPCVDTGLWSENTIDIKRIVPDLPRNYILFVTFGEYKQRSNFKLVIDAMEHMISFMDNSIKEKVHLVVAGHCSERSLTQKLYYNELISKTKEKSCAPKITFLKQLPTVHKKTLIKECVAVVHPTRHDVYPGPILAAMSLGRPVIGVNCGFSSDVLMHRLTGILVEPDPHKFARVMYKLATSPTLEMFIGDMARNSFNALHCFERFSRKLNTLVMRQVDPEYDK